MMLMINDVENNTLSKNMSKVKLLFRKQAWNLLLDQEINFKVQYNCQVNTQSEP